MMPPLRDVEVMACADEESSFDCATGESSTGESSDPDEESSLGGEDADIKELLREFRKFNELESLGIKICTDPMSPIERQEQTTQLAQITF